MSSKKNNQKNKPHTPKENSTAVSFSVDKKLVVRLSFLIALISFLLYSNTLNHQFVLDDNSVINENHLTQGGVSSLQEIFSSSYREGYGNNENNLYRPLTKAMFAIEWSISKNNPHFHHLINILFFSLACVLLFHVLIKYTKINIFILLLTVLIFAAHPLHTEVVANIKSRDELSSMIFILLSLLALDRYLINNRTSMMMAMLACFSLALLSKESAIVFVALLPLFLHFFTKTPLKRTLKITGGALTVALAYIALHIKIIGSIGIKIIPVIDNSLLQSTSFFEQKATAIYILGKYLLLLLFPYPLSSDYSFNTIPMVTTIGHFGFLLALGVHLYLLYVAVKKWKEKNILSFCIFFYFITMALASNIFMLIGTHLAERLLFLPSVAFCLAFTSLLSKLFKFDIYDLRSGFINQKNKSILIITGIVFTLFTSKTFSRNKDWETDTTLFAKDIQTVPNSAHMLFYYANNLANQNTLDSLAPQERETRLLKAQKSINKALLLFDLFPDAHNVAGRIYYAQQNFPEAYKSYSRAMKMSPAIGMYHNNLGTSLFAMGKFDEAAIEFQKATELNKYDSEAQCNLGSAYGAMGETYKNKGDLSNATKMFRIAIENFKKATVINPNYKSAYQFVGITYKNLGDSINGQLFLDKAAKIKK